MAENAFPCPACGGPLEANPGEKRTVCGYCGVTVTVPESYIPQKKVDTEPPKAQTPARPAPPPPRKSDQEQVADVLRKAQPIATGALNTYAWWTGAKRFIPGCIIVLVVLCLLACLASAALITALAGNFNF